MEYKNIDIPTLRSMKSMHCVPSSITNHNGWIQNELITKDEYFEIKADYGYSIHFVFCYQLVHSFYCTRLVVVFYVFMYVFP